MGGFLHILENASGGGTYLPVWPWGLFATEVSAVLCPLKTEKKG